jgi:lipopolysaccharide/colanic/teichoic acid biosynthesis glycosyltransferase
VFDGAWALASPIIALSIRSAPIFTIEAAYYCLISLAFTLIAYSAFRLHEGVSRFFSVHDAWNVVRAVASAELMTCLVLFTLTRLEYIPRSTPLIHALILCAGLIAIRAIARLREVDSGIEAPAPHHGAEQVIIIGATKLSFLFMKFLAAYCPGERRVIALLDSPRMIGRSVFGVPIVGPPGRLQPIIDEFAEHGVSIDRVVVGGDEDLLGEETLKEVQRVCDQREIPLNFVPQLVGLTALEPQHKAKYPSKPDPTLASMLSPYFRWKYAFDFVLAAILLVAFAPFFMVAAAATIFDVGFPIVFWQQRLAAGGRTFTIYKFRTLRPPFDQFGEPIHEEKRQSWLGSLLRRLRLDELPQLFNVLVGEMSLIGPRPLLPHDQPANPTVRLMVRPGITGWAQVNGGTLLTASEKDALDEWYIRNASFSIDLHIMVKTAKVLIWGQSRPDESEAGLHAIRNARSQGPHIPTNEAAGLPTQFGKRSEFGGSSDPY